MRLALLSLCLCITAELASAGAWPRKSGEGFASTSARLSWPQDVSQRAGLDPAQQYYTLYVEYGLTDRLTLGLDLGRSVSGSGKSVVFLQYPLRDRDRGAKVSVQLGFGRISGENAIRPGLSVGWGLKQGWFSLDSVAEVPIETGMADYKFDVTWGRNMLNGRKLILQLQTGVPARSDVFARFAPSMVFPLTKSLKAEAGVTYGLTGDDSFGIMLGLWKEF